MKQFTTLFIFVLVMICGNIVIAQTEDCNNQTHFNDLSMDIFCAQDPECDVEYPGVILDRRISSDRSLIELPFAHGFDLNCSNCIDCQFPEFTSANDVTVGVGSISGNHTFFNGTLSKNSLLNDLNTLNGELEGDYEIDADIIVGLVNIVDEAVNLEDFFQCLNLDCFKPQFLNRIKNLLDSTTTITSEHQDVLDYLKQPQNSMDALVRNHFQISSQNKPPCQEPYYYERGPTGERSSSSEAPETDIFINNILSGEFGVPNPTEGNFFSTDNISGSVNQYNGLAEASIHIMSFINKDISIPISLSYDGSGVKLDNFGGSTGQNWSLSNGASISRKVNGIPDEFNGTQHGVGMAPVQKIKPCLTIGGLGLAFVTPPEVLFWTMHRPNELMITISIPIPIPFVTVYLTFSFVIKVNSIVAPGKVNFEEKAAGYLSLNDPAVMSGFGTDDIELNHFFSGSTSTTQKSKFLNKANTNKDFNDFTFLHPQFSLYVNFFEGIMNLFREPVIKSQKIDTEPDEFYINLPGYSGKFMFDQNGDIFTFPHGDLIIEKEMDGNQLTGFKVLMPDGLTYYFGYGAVDESRTAQYTLPNIFTYYPNQEWSLSENKYFNEADLDESEYYHPTLLLCLPKYKNYKKSYENDHVLMDGIEYISKWHLVKVESRPTGLEVDLQYEQTGELSHYSSQNFSLQFPNLKLGSSSVFETSARSDLKNGLNGKNHIYMDGSNSLTYSVTQSFLKKSRLKSISGSLLSNSLSFSYDKENPEIPDDYLLSSIQFYQGSTSTPFKVWELEYEETRDCTYEFEEITCTGSQVSTINVSVPGEYQFKLHDAVEKKVLVAYLNHVAVVLGSPRLAIPISFLLQFVPAYGVNRSHITELNERSSVLQLKGYHGLLDIELESELRKAEYKRVFLKSVYEVSQNSSDQNIVYVDLEYYFDLCSIPKKFSLAQDIWGAYNGFTNNGPLPLLKYRDYQNNIIVQDNINNAHLHLGLRSINNTFLPEKNLSSNEASAKIGALKSITYKSGLSYNFDYDLNDVIDHSGALTKGGGLRVKELIVNPGIGPSKKSTFEYDQPSQIAIPILNYQNNLNKTMFQKETYVSVSSSPFNELQMNKSNYVGYKRVTEHLEGNGRIMSMFTTPADPEHAPTKFGINGIKWTLRPFYVLNSHSSITINEDYDPFAPLEVKDWRLGNIKEMRVFSESGDIVSNQIYSYNNYPAYYCRTDTQDTIILGRMDTGTIGAPDDPTAGIPPFNHILRDDDPENCGGNFAPSIYSVKKAYFQRNEPPPFDYIQSIRDVVSQLNFRGAAMVDAVLKMIQIIINPLPDFLKRKIEKHQLYSKLQYTSEQYLLANVTSREYFDDGSSLQSTTSNNFKVLKASIHPDFYGINTIYRPKTILLTRVDNTVGTNNNTSSIYYYPFDETFNMADAKINEPKMMNVYKNMYYNFPVRTDEKLNGTLVSGNITRHTLYTTADHVGAVRLSMKFELSGENFVPTIGFWDWNARGNPQKVQLRPVNKDYLEDGIKKGVLTLSWSTLDDLLLQKQFEGTQTMVETYAYNDFNQLESQTAIDGIVSTYEYDGFGRVKKAILQNGLQENNYQYTFNPTTKRVVTNFPDGGGTQRMKIEYNGLGQTLKTSRTLLLAATFEENEYDNMFRLKTQSVMGRGTVENTYRYSPVERLTETVDSEGNLTKYRYLGASGYSQIDGAEQVVEVTDPNGHKYIDIMDGLSRKVGSISGEGGVTTFQYDNQGRIQKITNPISEEYLYSYNNLGLLSQKKVPNAAPEEYYYDDFRMPLMTHDGNGNYFSKERDHYFREINTYWTSSGLSPTVDGTLNYVTNPQALYNASEVVNAITYDSGTNRIKTITETLFGPVNNSLEKTSTFTYDNFGRVIEEDIIYPEGITVNNKNTYTAGSILRDLNKEINGTTYTISNSFDIINRPVNFTFSTGSFNRKLTTVKYDSEDRVSSKDLFGISTPLQTVDYGYDAIGRLITINSPFTTECEVPEHYGKEICFFEIEYKTQNYQTVSGSPSTFPCYEIDRINIDGVEYNLPNSINMTSPDFDAQLESFIHSLNFEGNVVLEIEYIPVPGPGGSVSINPNGAKKFVLKIFDADFESITLLSVLYPGSAHCSHTLTRLNCCPAEDPEEEDPDPQNPNPNPDPEGDDLFFETIVYNGLDIRQIDMGNGCNLGIIRNQYRYDADHRLRSVKNFMIFESETQENNYNSLYEYDAAGNITSLKRRGFLEKDAITGEIFYDDVDDLSYTYGANSSRLTNVQEALLPERGVKFGNYGFGYDGKGNALSMMGSTLSYNPINLPKIISTSTGEERIWYTINGEKFKIEADTEVIEDEEPVTETRTRYLVQGFELTDGGAVHSFNFGDGRILLPGGEDSLASPRVQFHLKDHLGNVMVVFEDKDDDNEIDIEDTEEPNEIIERFMYYAFGMQWEGAWMYDEPIDTEENRYRYNGKEFSKGSRLSDYGFRYYSSEIGRWNAVDPLAEEMASWSPYNYVFGNPVSLIDPLGLSPQDPDDPPSEPSSEEKTYEGYPIPDIVVTAPRPKGSFHDQSAGRYEYNGTFKQWQKTYGFEGMSYENASNFWNVAYGSDFDNYVAERDKAEAARIALERLANFAQWYAMVATVTGPASGGSSNGANYSGPGIRTFNYNPKFSGIRMSLVNNQYFVNSRGPGYWARPGHGKFPFAVNKSIILDGKMAYNSINNSWNFSINGFRNGSPGNYGLGIRGDGGIFHSTFYNIR